MKISFPFIYTFLASFFLVLVWVRSDLIRDSCNKAAKQDPDMNFDFCVASLEHYPKSKTATSTEDLVLISIDIAISNATSISSIISMILKNKKLENITRVCLEDCSDFYSLAVSDLQSSVKDFMSKAYGPTKTDIGAAMDATVNCEDGFKLREVQVSPLTKENSRFFHLPAIPLYFRTIVQ